MKLLDRIFMFFTAVPIALILSIGAVILGYSYFTTGQYSYTMEWPVNGSPLFNNTVQILPYYLFFVFIASLRMIQLALRTSPKMPPSIQQQTEFGEVKISLDTIEHLSYQAATRIKSVKEVKTRIKGVEQGLEIMVKVLVDGEVPIPNLSEEIQKNIREHVQNITGIPVARISVFIANVVQSQTYRGA